MSKNPMHSVSVAGVTFDDANRVLLVRRRDNGDWQAPGGVLELEETFEQGVVREVLEETGVEVAVEALTGVYKNLVKGVVALVYRCRAITGEPSPTEESLAAAWIAVDDISDMMTPAFAVRVTDAVPGRRNTVASRAHNGTYLLDGYVSD